MPKLAAVGIVAALAAAVLAQNATASAVLKADYRFQDSHTSSVAGAPVIDDVGPGNAFATEKVGCKPARVLTFPQGSGVQLGTGPLVPTNHYSVDVIFRLADVSGFRRIMAPGIGGAFATDSGLYNYFGKLDFYDTSLPVKNVLGPAVAFTNDVYAEVALAYPFVGSEQTAGYVNGVRQFSYASTGVAQATLMRFFKDNDSGGNSGEDSAGAVARIRIYDGTLSGADVAAIHRAGPLGDRCRRASVAIKRKVTVGRGRHRRLVVRTGIDAGCPPGGSRCGGIATVDPAATTRADAARSRRTERLGKATLSVAAGKTRRVKVKLTHRASNALRQAGKLRVQISVELSPSGGFRNSAARDVTIRAPGHARR